MYFQKFGILESILGRKTILRGEILYTGVKYFKSNLIDYSILGIYLNKISRKSNTCSFGKTKYRPI